MGTIIAVCRSDKKSVRKQVVPQVLLEENYGVATDAHADSTTHRQVSLLAEESIAKMRKLGLDVGPGDFAENLTTRGIELVKLPIGTRLAVGKTAVLEVSQIGKICHIKCAIFQQVGTCIMPEEGIFGRVVEGGPVVAGDEIRVIPPG
jgi:MOSC domain-containing protein YiiM